MARFSERYPDNVTGEFYVDRSCIDCDTCTRVAPGLFAEAADHSFVVRQPRDAEETRRALMALVACPTASIGTVSHLDAAPGVQGFPQALGDDVFFLGFTAESSFGAWSYLVRRQDGNVIVDSPRAAAPLLRAIDTMGGARFLFLTHRDDVADHQALAKHFGCERVLHAADVTSGTRAVERRLEGRDPITLADDLVAIPVPGHTKGHAVLLHRDETLFTGDHLAWSPERQRLTAFRDVCWYSWAEQTASMERLLEFRFERILPGHGAGWRAPSARVMREELERLIVRMRRV